MSAYPDDADGHVLSDMANYGIDMTQPLVLEFPIAAIDEEAAKAIFTSVTALGYEAEVEFDDGEPEDSAAEATEGDDEDGDDEDEDDEDEDAGPSWNVYVTKTMVPDYEEILRIQDELDELAEPLGGYSDGWGAIVDEAPEE